MSTNLTGIPTDNRSGLLRIVPKSFELQTVPLAKIAVTVAVSAMMGIGGYIYGAPLWLYVLLAIIPWVPIFFIESLWKYEHYGFYAFMVGFTLLQIGHLGEHTAQVTQLMFNGGVLKGAHGVFGALDRELVHFTWDSLVWLGVLLLLYKLGPHNKWLWISLVASSFHEVEHVFLFYLDRFHTEFYDAGGTSGILAKGGVIGSPYARPYQHFIYNFFVVVPLMMATWDETKRAYNLFLARALPSLTHQEKVSTSAQLDRLKYKGSDVIVRQGDVADHFYIVSKGQVEVVREGDSGEELIAILGPGHFFGEMGLLTGRPRMATVRAMGDVEVLALDKEEFTMMVTRSKGGAADLDSELHERLEELRDKGLAHHVAGGEAAPAS
jgi:hypothetical protein